MHADATPAATTAPDDTIPTFGVEEEFLIVALDDGRPTPVGRAVADTARDLGLDLQLELLPCQVETNTPVSHTSREVDAHLRLARKNLACAAGEHSVRPVAAGAPAVYADPTAVTPKPRYESLANRFGLVATEVPVCGCHVHVALEDQSQAAWVSNYLRQWLPTLLALSANSAICNGRDTRYASWRTTAWGRLPTAGPPPHWTGPDHLRATVEGLVRSGAAMDDSSIYWDIRPSTHYPTIEVRVCDVPGTVDETVLIAILTRAAVMTGQQRVATGEFAPAIADSLVQGAYWRAARDGISGDFMDLSRMRVAPARDCVDSMVAAVRPALEQTGEFEDVTELIDQVFGRGNGAIRQRQIFQRNESAADVVDESARLTLQ